jgi:hypothetical protein
VEPRYEDSTLLRYVAHSLDCARSRRNTNKATDRRREVNRSNEAEGARWLQARRNGQGNEALGRRMHGDAGAKNRYAIRRVRSVGPRRGGRDHAEGSAVTLQFMCNLYSIITNQEAIRALYRHRFYQLPPKRFRQRATYAREAGIDREQAELEL